MFQLFVRWNKEGEGYDVVELVRKDTGEIVFSSGVFHNNRDRVYGYCQGVVDATNTGRKLHSNPEDLQMPRCLTQRGGVARHLCADTSRQD